MQKISKVHMWIYYNPLTSQNSSPISMSLSGIIFNHTSSLTNEWTPPFFKYMYIFNLQIK